jgi:uncharacterized protein YndB with AHSA1/START domain
MTDRTVRLHRVLRTTPANVYRAFLDARAMARWLPPFGYTCTVHHLDARVGGTELNITQTGIPEAIPLSMCYLGWQESLAQLATLVDTPAGADGGAATT